MARKAEQGALQYAASVTEVNPPRIGGAGFISGVFNDFLANPRLPFNRLTPIGRWLGYFWDSKVAPLALNFADGSNTLDSRITFSRSSNATVTDSNGNIVYAPHNLLTFSEQFDNSAWVKSNATVTANTTTAPDGTNTADKLVASGGAIDHLIDQNSLSISSGMIITESIYAKAAECTEIRVRIANAGAFSGAPQSLTFTLSGSGSGVIEQGSPSFSITSVGNGWYRCSITATTVATGAITVRFSPSISRSTTFNADGSGIFLWGAQLNVGSLQPYYPTTVKNLLGFSEAFDNAAWTKSNSFIQTNLLTFSEMYTNAAWTKNASTISANVITAPNGAMTADLVNDTVDAVASAHQVTQTVSVTSGIAYTLSAYIKAGTGIGFSLGAAASGAFSTEQRALYNASTGVASSVLGFPTNISMVAVGNGWYRCSCTITPTSTATATIVIRLYNSAGSGFYQGDGTQNAYLWGVQLVQGSVAGDYVQTTSTALPVMYQAPNGTMTADKLVEDTANSTHFIRQTPSGTVNTSPYTLSIYAKAAERTYLGLAIQEGSPFTRQSNVNFDLVNGTVGPVSNIGGSAGTASITPVGNGWYRCSLTVTLGGSATSILAWSYISTVSGFTYTGNGTSGIYIWGAQLSDSASLDTYVNNPVAAPSSTAYYGPRFDYDPVTKQPKGLLIEESRANLVLNSGFTGAVGGSPGTAPTSWTIGFGTGAQTSLATSIYGTADGAQAVKFDADATERIMYIQSISVTSGVQYAFSVELEAVSGNIGDLLTVISGTATATQNTFVTNPSSVGRRTILFTATGTGTVFVRVGIGTTAGAPNTCSCTISRCQLEAGSFPTSYIPTTTATVTRAADVAVIQGSNFSSWYKYDNGTFLGEGSSFTTQRPLVAVDDGSMSNRFQLTFGSSYTPNFATVSGGAVSADLFTSALTQSSTVKLSGAYGVNDFALSANGSAVQTDTSGALPVTLNIMRLGAYQNGTILNGYIRRINYYNRRLDNSQLQAITQ